jgi:hypothetical protein
VKLLTTLLCILLLSGCAQKMAALKPASKNSYFVLSKDLYTTDHYGLMKYLWVHGLKAGTYRLVAEDDEGFYYQGQGDSVFFLSEERAERYLKDGYIASYEERYVNQISAAGGHGGIWFPRDPTKHQPELFYILYSSPGSVVTAGVSTSGVSAQNTGLNPAGAIAIGALTTSIGNAIVDGTVQRSSLDFITKDPTVFNRIDQ